ncbi:MAG: MotA/TolQ/ExbB proton channel family protein [Burkholderiaceae bacterium]
MLFGLSETALTAGVAGLLWALSVSSWVVIVYKTWWIWRALQDVPAAQQAYWQTPDPVQAQQVLVMLDRQALLQPLVGAACASKPSSPAGLERRAHEAAGRQRQVVQSLRQVCQQVQWGQPWLACVASVAPFLGLLGTVWGLLDAMTTLPDASTGAWEAWVPALSHTLQLTAVGLCVAVPAVMAHHLMANRLNMLQQSLEDFAADLIEHLHSGQDA